MDQFDRHDIETTQPTPLIVEPPGARRLLHSLAYQAPLRFARRVMEVGAEVALARLVDARMARRMRSSQVVRHEAGGVPATTGGRRVALYLHYSASGHVSAMVQAQLAGYRALGFDVVFASNAERLDEAGWQAAAPHCWRLIHRRNIGFDFGAWRDAAELLRDAALRGECDIPDELLLVNDSVIGPIRPLAPLLRRARLMGPGAVGLTESRQGGVHLQSYFVFVSGVAAVADTLDFLHNLRLSKAKWLMVQRGEFGLTRHLVRCGHRVAALFGYAEVVDAILADPEERRYLASFAKQFAGEDWARTRANLLRWPLNPTIHMWRGLPRCLGFPFLKVALLHRNVGRLPGLATWPALLDSGGFDPALARDHLATLDLPFGSLT
jgi:hypothetical protein